MPLMRALDRRLAFVLPDDETRRPLPWLLLAQLLAAACVPALGVLPRETWAGLLLRAPAALLFFGLLGGWLAAALKVSRSEADSRKGVRSGRLQPWQRRSRLLALAALALDFPLVCWQLRALYRAGGVDLLSRL